MAGGCAYHAARRLLALADHIHSLNGAADHDVKCTLSKKEATMFCSACGHQNEATSKFCASCGKPLVAGTQQVASPPAAPSPQEPLEPGRGGLILTFGILSIVPLGPILGIPAWVMGHRDLKKIRAGLIAVGQQGLTQAGMILGIIGTFVTVVGAAIAVGLSLFSAQSIQSNRDAMINDLNNLAAMAYQYRVRPASLDGGAGTYTGFTIPAKMQTNENATYVATVQADEIEFVATSAQNTINTVTVKCEGEGRLH